MMKKIGLFLFCIFSFSMITFSQVGINTINPKSNTDLTLGSKDKGFLPNKVTLTSTTSISPLTGEVESGTIVYHTPNAAVAGSTDLGEGLYYWTGNEWIRFTTTTAKQQDSRLLTFKKTGDVSGTDEIQLGYLTEAQVNAGSIGTEIPSLATSFSVDKEGTIFVMSVLYAKLQITGNLNYAYVGNTFFRVRVTNTVDNTYSDFIAGCSPISTTQSGSAAIGGSTTATLITANNNPAVAVAQGSLAVKPDVSYDVKVYGLEGWVTANQGYVTSGTYMWRTFKLYSTLKIDFVSVAY